MLRVIYTDGTFDLVKDFMLRFLIESYEVAKFKRSSGWVEIGSPNVRGVGGESNYCGSEKRGL
jgi:hypothetical protein